MDYLGLKDSSRQLRAKCAISYSFYLHLMLYACAARFSVTGNLEKFWILGVSFVRKFIVLRTSLLVCLTEYDLLRVSA